MDFGPVPLDQALGAVLAHSVPLAKGRLRKGTVLAEGDLAALRAAGRTEVTVARLAPDDLDEDAAALALAEALVEGGEGLTLKPVGTGRVNIHATGPGLARIGVAQVDAVNAADPAITLATVPEWQRMDAGGMVATVKIITYGVDETNIHWACLAANKGLSLARPVLSQAVMVETVVGDGLGDKGWRVTADRLDRLGVTLAPEVLVRHEAGALAKALQGIEADLILILTASATSDIRDVAPEGVRLAGGNVSHFGMPVDPGNLLFLGDLRGTPVVGLPGCARSPALNGADWVLERLICGIPIGPADILRMGVGGLLKDIPTRPRPR